jgi:type IV pilus assembly protein PilO
MNDSLVKLGWSLHGLGLAASLAAAGLTYALVFRPLETSRRESAARREEIAMLLQSVDQLRSQRDGLRKALADVDRERISLLARVPDAPQEADFLSQISCLADSVGLKLRDYRPGQVHTQASYSEMEIGLSCEGGYEGLCRFLDGLGRLPRLVNLEQLDVTDQQSNGTYPASMKLVIYFGAQSEATAERKAPHG